MRVIAGFLAFAALTQSASATLAAPLTSGQKSFESAGTGLAIALPIAAAGIAWQKDDMRLGWTELAAETLFTVGTAYGLKQVVHEERPNGADDQSFPSDTTALAASGSSFLWGRYGWQYGLPATLLTGLVAYSRVQSRDHHWYDTAASVGISAAYGYIVTTPFQRRYNVQTELTPTRGGAQVRLSYAW